MHMELEIGSPTSHKQLSPVLASLPTSLMSVPRAGTPMTSQRRRVPAAEALKALDSPRTTPSTSSHEPLVNGKWDKDAVCEICPRKFATKYQAKKHFLRRHFTGEKEHLCERCRKKAFAVREDLTMHLKACGRVFACSCGLQLRTQSTLKRHCKLTHHEPLAWDGVLAEQLGTVVAAETASGMSPQTPDRSDERRAGTSLSSAETERSSAPKKGARKPTRALVVGTAMPTPLSRPSACGKRDRDSETTADTGADTLPATDATLARGHALSPLPPMSADESNFFADSSEEPWPTLDMAPAELLYDSWTVELCGDMAPLLFDEGDMPANQLLDLSTIIDDVQLL